MRCSRTRNFHSISWIIEPSWSLWSGAKLNQFWNSRYREKWDDSTKTSTSSLQEKIILDHPETHTYTYEWDVSSTPFLLYFLVHLHFNLVSSLLALFATQVFNIIISVINWSTYFKIIVNHLNSSAVCMYFKNFTQLEESL